MKATIKEMGRHFDLMVAAHQNPQILAPRKNRTKSQIAINTITPKQ